MKLGITATMKRQLADMRDAKGNARKGGGVLVVPRMLGVADARCCVARSR
jgi:hypothetical protein